MKNEAVRIKAITVGEMIADLQKCNPDDELTVNVSSYYGATAFGHIIYHRGFVTGTGSTMGDGSGHVRIQASLDDRKDYYPDRNLKPMISFRKEK